MNCPGCGSHVSEEKRFCDECGTALPIVCSVCSGINRAEAKFCGDCGTRLTTHLGTPARGQSRTPLPAPGRPVPEAERRHLTVVFCDLVGSTALSARLDPEDMRELIRAYQECCTEVVARFDGNVAKYMGDGVLVYFGYPRAHEDAAERAIRASLAITEAVGMLKSHVQLQVRVGIATGLVVVGDLIGHGAAQEQAVIGETPNLAARLQALAEPDTILIAESTYRLIAGVFDCEDLGLRLIKGFAKPAHVWRVTAETPAENRFEARHAGGMTPLVGREREIALLCDCWRQAKEGEGQAVLLSGEPGIGKSRILRALRDRLDANSHLSLRYSCSPYHQTSPLYPFVEQLERAAGIVRNDTPKSKLDKLERLLAQGAESLKDATPLIAALLSIPAADRSGLPSMSPQRQKEKTFEALLAQLDGLAARQPVLLLFEDVHWIDPTSLELLDLVVDRVQHLPVLLVITFRPEFMPSWSGYAHVTAVRLNRLSPRQVTTMIGRVTGGKDLPRAVVEQLLLRTDGVPLFVEELTKAVLESGLVIDQGDHYALPGPLPPLAIPATLQDSLMARLDHLTPVKEVAQIGAVIGRSFSFELVAAVAPMAESVLREALDQLVEAELVFRRGVAPEVTYTFKHALIQDAAYGTLLRGKRQQLHARVAEVLEKSFPDTVKMEPELLARHCAEAGFTDKAIDYWRQAALLAAARSATSEAITQLSKAFDLLALLRDAPDRQWQELGLQVTLGKAITAAKGFAAPEAGQAYARARELCEQLGETVCLSPILYGLILFHLYRGEMVSASEVARQLLRLAERQGTTTPLFYAHRAMGVSCFPTANFASARTHLEQALALYDPVEHRDLAILYAFDPKVVCLDYLSRTLLPLGYPEQALARHNMALNEARRISHLSTLAFTLFYGCVLHQLLQDRQGVQDLVTPLMVLAEEQAFPIWSAGGLIAQGWLLAEGAQKDLGIQRMHQGLEAWRATGAEFLVPYFLGLLAEAYGKVGQIEEGLGLLTQALTHTENSKERWFEAELHRLKGTLLLSRPEPDVPQADMSFQRALRIAHTQGARFWEVRAATSLCRVWFDQGKCIEGLALLKPVYDSFTEGFDTADLLTTKTLLDSFGGAESRDSPPLIPM